MMGTPEQQGLKSLPHECLQHVYGLLDVASRVRGTLVCRDWAAALATGVLPSLTLTCDDPHGMWEWLAQSHLQPAALHITGTPEFSLENGPIPALVARFATRATVLTYRVWYPSIEALLPAQNLVASCQLVEALDIGVVSTAYLGVVAHLPRLRRLHLCVEPEHQGQALAFPSMPRLTRLQLSIRPCEHGAYDDDDEDAWFHYFGAATLGALPAMEELAITAGVHNRHSRRGTPVDLRTAGSMPRLRQLTLLARAAPAALDFRMLPALRSLRLWAPREVTGAESVGESLELQTVELGEREEADMDQLILERSWVACLLYALPPSVRALTLRGRWGPGTAAALGEASNIQVLSLVVQLVDWSDAPEDKTEPHGPVVVYPPREAPLWRNLRALHWFCDQLGARPPAVLRATCRLELLQVDCLRSLTKKMVGMLCALPALRALHLPWFHGAPGEVWLPRAQATLATLCHAMPGVVVADQRLAGSSFVSDDDFVLRALAELG